ncbi:MAG: ABC transporter substrate-binding protein, partial [Caldivirga sp.]|uniref:ABC transporter substrate-binding protein n=1 Tax=Caldivirga sp. TaxID=2080243 RepID=UPI003D0A32EB
MTNISLKTVGIALSIMTILLIMYSIHVTYAQQKPQIIFPVAGATFEIAPGTPIYNPWNPIGLATCGIASFGTYLPLAFYSYLTGQYLPVLARNWTIQLLPNGSALFTIYLRPGLYWYNGSATMPFTAWDLYAEYYIGIKSFSWWTPFINQSLVDEDLRVLNNYTLQILVNDWSPLIPVWVLTQCINAPYFVWEPVVNELKTMNVTQAMNFSTNITKIVVPYWGIYPWYLTYFSNNYMTLTLEPSNLLNEWFRVFPLADWYYYDPTYEAIWGPNSVAYEYWYALKATWGSAGFSWQQTMILASRGVGIYFAPAWMVMGIYINPHYYPYNIPQVREALCYVINRTEVGASWGLAISKPAYYPEPVIPETIDTYPPSIRQFIIPCSYDQSKAAQMLQSIGFKKVKGYWYTPNGTQLTLEVLAPSGFTDWMTMAADAVTQLDAFGINAKLIGQDVGVFWGTTIPNGMYQAATSALGGTMSYSSAWSFLQWPWWRSGNAISAYVSGSDTWPFQWPNGTCTPVTAPASLKLPNNTVVWCVNSTFGYINLTNWQVFFDKVAEPNTPLYDLAIETIFAWYYYFVPAIPLYDKITPLMYAKSVADVNWTYDCLPTTTNYAIVGTADYWWTFGPMYYVLLGAYAPPGEVPLLAQAIANGSLWTNPRLKPIAVYLGLPTPDTSIQQCVAKYFHIPYTPVTSTTTTSTTTTTTTTTSTTTSTTTPSTSTTTTTS